jgi:hypothetical protein
MSVDLDINNYNLDDVLKLFKLPLDFDESHMKKAKQVVLKTHPDKSGLSPDYFIFYSKAYKMLYTIWEFRKKGDVNNTNKNNEYVDCNEGSEEQKLLLNNFFKSNKKFKNNSEFNKWFNSEFEKNKLTTEIESKGYDDWLKSNEEVEDFSNVTMATMKQEFDKKKTQARALIVREDIQEITHGYGASELSLSAPSSFDSDMFSNLPYQDLYKAHTESVIPVTDEDYNKKQKFKNVNEFVSYRNNQDVNPLTEQQAHNFLMEKNRKEEEVSVRRAYELAKQTEIAKQKNQSFWSNIKMLNNS